jgi:rubrerythrin
VLEDDTGSLVAGRWLMTLWKCSRCGYTIKQEKPPEPCPSCGEKCEFLNATCYTPDCKDQEIDKRIR